MSETKRKNASMGRLVLVLFAVTAIVALLLGLVDSITRDRIAANTAEKTAQAMRAVLDAESYEPVAFTDDTGLVTAAYAAAGGGWVIEVAPSGFGGTINMVVGVKDRAVTGVSIVKMSETSGLGANAKNTSFREQYVGKSGMLAVNKDGGEIQALTGATVTSRAVTRGVNAALAAAAALDN